METDNQQPAPRFQWGQTVYEWSGSTVHPIRIVGIRAKHGSFVYEDSHGITYLEGRLFANREEIEKAVTDTYNAAMADIKSSFPTYPNPSHA